MCCSTLKIGKILFILGIYLHQLGKKTYFLALGTIPVIGVGFIGRKITEMVPIHCLLQYQNGTNSSLTGIHESMN